MHNANEHTIISQIRADLAPFLNSGEGAVHHFVSHHSRTSDVTDYAERLVRKIPQRNYEKLARHVPISWL